MFTIKSIKKIILFVSCSLLLTSCYPSGDQLLSTEDNSVLSEEIENIVSDNEHFEIEVQLPEYPTELPEINVKVMDWDEDKLKEIFLAERTNLEYDEAPSDFFSNDKLCIYKQGTEYWLVYEPGRLTAEDRASPYGYGTMGGVLSLYRFEDFFTEDNINLLPKEDAINSCISLLEKIGITNYFEPKVYAITADKANEYWKENDYDQYKTWTADDEIYLMRFAIGYNDIPITINEPDVGSATGHGGYYVGSNIDFIVTKDKVFSLKSDNLFSPEYELGETVKINCSAENALKIAAEHYGGISLGEQNIKITSCELVYVPYEQHDEKNFTLIPMWEIDAGQYREDKSIMGIRNSLFIDAQTGKVIVW